MGCPCGKLSPDLHSWASRRKRLRTSESVWASLLTRQRFWGREGGWIKQREWVNEKQGEIRWQLISINNQPGVILEGLGLIKLFLVNTNNISNNSINLDNHNLSDFEPGLVPKWDRCYVCMLIGSLVPHGFTMCFGQAVCISESAIKWF